MNYPEYQCYDCGWSGNDPKIIHTDECQEIKDGLWVKTPEEYHLTCPDCNSIFAIIPIGVKK